MKECAYKKAVESSIRQGDIVVMKDERTAKIEPNFRPVLSVFMVQIWCVSLVRQGHSYV